MKIFCVKSLESFAPFLGKFIKLSFRFISQSFLLTIESSKALVRN